MFEHILKPETELEDLMVFRVDGVTNPATGSPFLILKSADSDELRVNAEELANRAFAVLKAFEGKTIEKDVAGALSELASALGIDFKISEPEQPQEQTQPAKEEGGKEPIQEAQTSSQNPEQAKQEGDDAPAKEVSSAAEGQTDQEAKAAEEPATEEKKLDIGKVIETAVKTAVSEIVSKQQSVPESRQAKVERVAKSSSGISFENIVFGS